MKSLGPYIIKSFITEANSKYIKVLRKYLEPVYKDDPTTFIKPEIIYPSGNGSLEDLVQTRKIYDMDNGIYKSSSPVIGVGEYEGEICVIVCEMVGNNKVYKYDYINGGTAKGDRIQLISSAGADLTPHLNNARPCCISMDVRGEIDPLRR